MTTAFPPHQENSVQPVRHSGRERHFPSKLLDYITGLQVDTAVGILNVIPENYNDIFGRPDTYKWKDAIADELKSMKLTTFGL